MTRFTAVVLVLAVAAVGRSEPNPPVIAGVGGPTCKICVIEPRPTTKVVYSSACKEFCLPECSLLSLLRKCGGCGCGEVRTRTVLIKKVAPGCDKPACVLKEVPAACPPAAKP